MSRPTPNTRYSFTYLRKSADSVNRQVLALLSLVKSLASGFSEMRSLISIRRSAVKGNFSIDAMKSSGLIKMMPDKFSDFLAAELKSSSFERLGINMKEFSLKAQSHLPRLITGIACVLFLLFSGNVFGQSGTVTGGTTGNWNAAATWNNVNINRTGTVTSSTGSSTVTGSGTSFLTQLTVGSVIGTQGGTSIGTVASIQSNTSLTLTGNASNSVSGQSYRTVDGPPSSVDAAIINTGVTVTVNVTNAVCASLLLGTGNGTANLTFSGSNPTLTVSGTVNVGGTGNDNRSGNITFTSGSTLVANLINLNQNSGGSGSAIIMTNGGLIRTGSFGTNRSAQAPTWTPGTGTVELTATNTLLGSIFTTFNNLIISAGTTTTGRTLTITNLSVQSGSTFSLSHAVTANAVSLQGGAPSAGGTISGSSTLTLGGNISVTDNTGGTAGATISAPVALGAARTVTVADDGTSATDLTISGVISGAFGLTKAGGGTMVLSGSNSYTGTTTISEGTLSAATIVVASSASSLGNATSAVVLGGASTSGILSYTGAAATFTRGITVNAGGGGITNTTSNLLTIGTEGITNGGALTFSNTGTGGTTVSSVISSTGSVAVNNSGTGVTTFSGSNTYTGSTTISQGTLSAATIVVASSASSLGNATSAVVLGGASTSGILSYTGAAATFTRGITVNAEGGGITNTTSNLLTIGTGGITNGGALTFSNTGTGGTTVSSVISSTGSVVVNNSGTGVTIFSGENTYTGATTVSAGTLEAGVETSSFGSNSAVTLANTAGVVLDITGFNTTIGSLTGGGTTGGNVTLGAATLTIGTNDSSPAAFAGIINGTGALTKSGTGVLILSGANTFTGETTINAGTLRLGAANALSGGAVTVNGGTWDVVTFSDAVGAVTLSSGSITGTTGVITGTSYSVESGTISAILAGTSVGLTKTTAGTVTLSGANTYTGATTVTEGVLQLSAADRIANTSNLILNGGTFRTGASVGFGETMGTLALSANSTIALGTGNHTLTFGASNAVSWTSGTTLTITGWAGNYSTGVATGGRIFVSNSASALTATQLGQISFSDGTRTYGASLTASGELRPLDTNPPSALSYTTPNVFTRNAAITSLSPTVTGAVTSYSISPTLPTGLAFNTTTGVISGTPSASQAPTNYTVTATNSFGNTTFTLSIGIGSNITSAGSGNWNATATWTGGVVPTAADNVTIASGHTVTVNINNAACAAVNFLSTSTVNATLSLASGGNLTVSGTVTIPRQGGSTINTLDVAAGTATVGAIAFTNGGGGVRHRVTISTGTLTVLGNVTTNVADVSASIIFSGAGTLNVGGQLMSSGTVGGTLTTFAGSTVNYNGNQAQTVRADTYSGNLTLSGSGVKTTTGVTVNGVLSREGTASLSVAPTYGASATLQYNTSAATTVGVEWPATWANASNGVIVSGTGTITLNENKALSTRPLTVRAGATLAVGSNTLGGISSLNLDTGGVTTGSIISGTGQITLAGDITVTNTAGGASATNESTTLGASITAPVALAAARTITVADNSAVATDLTMSGVISGAFALTKAGAGTLVLAGANSYTGATTISAGTLTLGAAGSGSNTPLGTTGAGTTVSSGAALDLNGFTLVTTEGLTLNGTGISTNGALTNTGGNATYSGAIALASASEITATNSGTLTLSGAISGDFALTIDGAGSGTISGVRSGSGALIKDGAGTWTLSGANTYTGATTINAGTLRLGAAGGGTNTPLGTTGSGTTVNSGAALDLNGFTLGTAEALSLNGTGISNGGALTNGSGTAATYSGVITFATAASIVGEAGSIAITGTPVSATTGITLGGTTGGSISTAIAGARTLTKIGSGTWTLSGNNTYTGATTLTEGILQLGAADRIANTSNLVLNGGTFRSGASVGFAETMGTVTLSENSTIALGTGNHTLTFSASNGVSWTADKVISVTGWTGSVGVSGTAGKLRIGTNTSGLTATQLAQFQFDGYPAGATLLANGEVVPGSLPPVITSSLTASSTYGTASSYTIAADFSPSSFNASLLPPGMSVNTTTGVITVGAATNAGTYNITISATNGAGTDTETLVYTVNKANTNITATGTTTFTYTGAAQGPSTSDKTGSTGAVTYSYSGTGTTTYPASATRPTNAGTYQVIATVATDANFNAATSVALPFTINKAVLTITAGNQTVAYGTSVATVTGAGTYTPTGFVNGETSAVIGGSATYTTTYTTTTGAGTAGVTITPVVTLLTATNYSFTAANGTITVSKANTTITATGTTTFTYSGAAQGPATSSTISSGVVSYSYSGTGTTTYPASATRPTNAGTYQVIATVATDANFNAATSVALPFTINKAVLTITAGNQTVTFGTPVATVTDAGTFTPTGFVNGETSAVIGGSATYTTTYTTTTAAGTAGITITPVVTLLTATNYSFTAVNGTITVSKINSTITATGTTTFTYSGTAQGPASSSVTGSTGAVTYSYSGTGTTTYPASATRPTNAGTYQVIATVAADANFNAATSDALAFTINRAALTVTAEAKTKIYGASDPVLTFQVTSGSLIGADVLTGSLARATGENVGTYAINQGTLANANYAITFESANLTITTRAITITADAKSKIYGNADPALTYQITSGSLAFTDSFSGSLSRATGENIGTYAITQGSLALNSNYALTYVGANLTITTRAITITADAKSKIYGNADPALTYQITTGSLASGDSFSGSLSRATGENVGTYAITQGSLALNSNYVLSYVGANLTITSRAITVTADAKSKEYGSFDPELTYRITSGTLASGDSFSGSLTRAVGETVGTYAITQGTLALTSNYTLTFVSANLTIAARAITVTADPQTKIYGATDPALTYQVTSGSLLSGDVLSGTLVRAIGENVGNYPILLGSLANANYSITFVTANFSITPKTLLITPDAGQFKLVSAADPVLTYVASGWERTDTSSLLSGALSRNSGEQVGTYEITLGTLAVSGSNYTLSITAGVTFEIRNRPATQLAFSAAPSGNNVAGQPFTTQPVIQIQNDLGNVVQSATGLVTLSLLEGTGELRGTVTLNAVNGVATFSGLNINLVGADKRLQAEATGLTSATTSAFTITPAPASSFTIFAGDQQVTQVSTAVDIAPAVRVEDIFGNPISGVSVTFAVSSGGGTIAPTTAVLTNSDGVASLTSWTLGATLGNNTLTASTSGFSNLTFTALASQDATVEYSTNTLWTVPPGVTSIIVEGWGGGGAGGGSTNASTLQGRGGAGGGGGAYAKKTLTVTPGQVLDLRVGAGGIGASGANGGDGNDTFIDGLSAQFLAKGGAGGTRNVSGITPTGGTGGTVNLSAGDQLFAGATGGNGATGFGAGSGVGGRGANNGGLGGASRTSGTTDGNLGTAPGGGGGGGRTSGTGGNRAGGAGGAGRIKITYPQPVDLYRAAVSGNWEDAATWEQQFSNGQYARIETKPVATSQVIISRPGAVVQNNPTDVRVQVNSNFTFNGTINVVAGGELAVASTSALTLGSTSTLTVGDEGTLSISPNASILGAGNIAVARGATLKIANTTGIQASGTTGALQNTGARTFSSNATYVYNGTAAQVIGNGLPAVVESLVIDNTTVVTLDRALEVSLNLEMNAGRLELDHTLTVDLGMTLNGTSQVLVKPGKTFQADLLANLVTNGTSRVVINPGAKYLNLGISTPRLEVQQQLTGARGWRMLGAPVTGATYQSFLTGLESQGFPGSANPTLQPNVLWWDEQDGGTTVQGWRQPGNITQSVPAGRGHYVFVFNGAAKKAAGTGNYSDALPLTLSTIGNEVNLNNGGFNFGVSYTKRNEKFQGNTTTGDYTQAGAANEGFNLIANPTSSDIDFFKSAGWTKTNIDETIYIWDQNFNGGQGNFRTITSTTPIANRIIAPFQAFWVRTNAAAPSLIMNNEVKAAEFSSFYGRVLQEAPGVPETKLTLSVSGEGMLADATVRISGDGKDGLDPWDAFQLESLNNNWLNLYTLGSPKELTPLVINNLSLPEEGEKTIPLYLAAAKEGKAFAGSYTLKWNLPADLPANTRVVLMDHINKKAIDMGKNQTYTFSFQAPTSTNARIRTEDGAMKEPQAVVFAHEIKEGTGENFRTASGQVTRPFSIVIGYNGQGNNPEYRPETPKIYPPSPNPFEDMTQIRFYLPVAEEAEVKVYDMKGQEVGSFERTTYPAGINSLEWRPAAVHLPKGVYLIQVQTETVVMTQKAVKL